MGFLEAYNRLEHLLMTFDEYPKGLESYIERMEACIMLPYRSASWDRDYDRLRRYRSISVRLADDDGSWERELCTKEDSYWLDDFYRHIINSTDPLTMYFKEKRRAEDEMLGTIAYGEQARASTVSDIPKKRSLKDRLTALFIKLIK